MSGEDRQIRANAVHALIFGVTVCPACAIREACPGGKFRDLVQRE